MERDPVQARVRREASQKAWQSRKRRKAANEAYAASLGQGSLDQQSPALVPAEQESTMDTISGERLSEAADAVGARDLRGRPEPPDRGLPRYAPPSASIERLPRPEPAPKLRPAQFLCERLLKIRGRLAAATDRIETPLASISGREQQGGRAETSARGPGDWNRLFPTMDALLSDIEGEVERLESQAKELDDTL